MAGAVVVGGAREGQSSSAILADVEATAVVVTATHIPGEGPINRLGDGQKLGGVVVAVGAVGLIDDSLLGTAICTHQHVADGLIRAHQVQPGVAAGAAVELDIDIGSQLVGVGAGIGNHAIAKFKGRIPAPAKGIAQHDGGVGPGATGSGRVVEGGAIGAGQPQGAFGQQGVAGVGVGAAEHQHRRT